MADPVIKVRDLHFAFGLDSVLAGVDLTLNQGEFLAIVGPNGGGKTTLLRLLLGLLTPKSGSIEVLGQSPASRLGNIGYVPQHTAVQPGFPVSVLEAVLMGIPRENRQRFGHAPKDRDRAMEALDRVGLFGREALRFGDLSGGQKQRTLIARALVGKAELLLLDEPTANVDPQGSFCLYDFLCTLASDERITIACVSHDLSILGSRITSIACVNRKLAYSPTPQLSQEMLEMLYGAHDHTCAMDEFMKSVSSQFGPEQHARHVRVPQAEERSMENTEPKTSSDKTLAAGGGVAQHADTKPGPESDKTLAAGGGVAQHADTKPGPESDKTLAAGGGVAQHADTKPGPEND